MGGLIKKEKVMTIEEGMGIVDKELKFEMGIRKAFEIFTSINLAVSVVCCIQVAKVALMGTVMPVEKLPMGLEVLADPQVSFPAILGIVLCAANLYLNTGGDSANSLQIRNLELFSGELYRNKQAGYRLVTDGFQRRLGEALQKRKEYSIINFF